MGQKQSKPSNNRISLEELREFIRTSRSIVKPEKVADVIAERELVLEAPEQLRDILLPLIEDLKKRLREREVTFPVTKSWAKEGSAKTRRMLLSLGVLQSFVADGLFHGGFFDEALAYASEAAEVCKAIEEYQMMTAAIGIESGIMRKKGDYAKALELQEAAHRLGVAQSDPLIIRRSLYDQGMTLSEIGHYDKSIAMFRQVVEMEEEGVENTPILGTAYQRIASTLVSINRIAEAEEAIRNGLEVLGENFPRIRTNLLLTRVRICMTREDYGGAFETIQQGLLTVKTHGTPVLEATLHRQLGTVQTRLGDFAKATTAYQNAFRIYDAIGAIPQRNQTLASVATNLGQQGELDRAREIFEELLQDGQSWQGSPDTYSFVLAHAGDFYTTIELFPEAEDCYNKALKLCSDASIGKCVSATMLKLGTLYSKEGRVAEAIAMFHQVLSQPTVGEESRMIIDACKGLVELYKARGDMPKAFEYQEKAYKQIIEEKDAVHNDRLTQLRVEHEVEGHRREAELERLRREKLEAELQETTVTLVEKSELIASLNKQIQKMLRDLETSEIPVLNAALQQIIRHVSESGEIDRKAVLLLHSVNDSFYEELRARHPDLTTGQVKLCGLIRSGMDTQDILELLHLSLSGLYKQRYRLRKQLGLKTKESIETYLAAIV